MEKEEKRADQENGTEEQSTEAKSLLKRSCNITVVRFSVMWGIL